MKTKTHLNPFRFGSLAGNDAFADREAELAELTSDIRNGQDVVIFAPRRCGKSSLAVRAAQILAEEELLVAEVDLMTTPTRESLAAALAEAIAGQIKSPSERTLDRLLAPFRQLRIQPEVKVSSDGSLAFSFAVGRDRAEMDATLAQLLQLPAALGVERKRRTALIIDEFQEIVEIDPGLPKLLRSVFQRQADVAHVYLGSKRHVMERIFSAANEPFWRSAKSIELGMIPPAPFAAFIAERFDRSERRIAGEAVEELLARTGGHPYATQELAYFLWEQTPPGETASVGRLRAALEAVLHSEHAHFSLLWEGASGVQRLVLLALAREPGRPFTAEYRHRHNLPPATNIQKALAALEKREVVAGEGGAYRIVEPFLAEWLTS
ncbi:MAG TPA: ATP-binding protein [Solirubrobacterales bacterium]|nr:ATP-binding protein [Solirubrobacterales bacterium]